MGSSEGQSGSKKLRIETTCQHGCSWLRSRLESAVGVFQLLIVVIEEHFVLQDRPAYRSAEVVVTLFRFGTRRWCVEVASRIKGIVLHLIEDGAVKLTGPSLENDVEDRTAAAVLGRSVCGNDIDLGDGFAYALIGVGAVRQPDGAAVDQIAGEVGHGSVDGLIERRVSIITAATAHVAPCHAGSAGKQLQQLCVAIRGIGVRKIIQLDGRQSG